MKENKYSGYLHGWGRHDYLYKGTYIDYHWNGPNPT